jgi:ribosomal peptide maturation radical SAM protein 1
MVNSHADVVFLVPPMYPAFQPMLAASQLKACLVHAGFSTDVAYFNIEFQERLGVIASILNDVSDCSESGRLGDYLFAHVLFDKTDSELSSYADFFEASAIGSGLLKLLSYWSPAPDLKLALECMIHQVRLWLPRAVQRLVAANPRYLAASTSFQTLPSTMLLLREFKKARPDVPTIVGGWNCAGPAAERILALFPQVDHVCDGEGDLALPELLRALRDGETPTIPGFLGRSSGPGQAGPAKILSGQQMDETPFPDHSDFFRTLDAHPGVKRTLGISLPMQNSRGCLWGQKHHCVFCGIRDLELTYREKSQDRSIAEIRWLLDTYGDRAVGITFSDNTTSPKQLRRFMPALSEAIPDLPPVWSEAQANLRREDIVLLRRANIREITVGIESLDSEALALMNKGSKPSINLQTLKWGDEHGVFIAWYWLVGFMGEGDSGARVADVIKQIVHLRPPQNGKVTPISIPRFSPYFERPVEYGIDDLNAHSVYQLIYPFAQDDLNSIAYYKVSPTQSAAAQEIYASSKQLGEYWVQHHGTSHLLSFRTVKRDYVLDTRPGRRRLLSRLRGVDRDLYRLCDAAKARAALVSALADRYSEEQVGAALEKLVARGLLLQTGNKYLALAVNHSGKYRDFAKVCPVGTVKLDLSPAEQISIPWLRDYLDRKRVPRHRWMVLQTYYRLLPAVSGSGRLVTSALWKRTFNRAAIAVLDVLTRNGNRQLAGRPPEPEPVGTTQVEGKHKRLPLVPS